MAVYRSAPICPFCGHAMARGVYIKASKNFYGDTFSHWDYSIHSKEECIINQRKKKLLAINEKSNESGIG